MDKICEFLTREGENIIMGTLDKLNEINIGCEEAIQRLGGKEDRFYKYLFRFPKEPCFIQAEEAFSEQDYETAYRDVHTFKGISANLGIVPVTDQCIKVLHAFKEKDYIKVAVAMEELRSVYDEICIVIEDVARLWKAEEGQ